MLLLATFVSACVAAALFALRFLLALPTRVTTATGDTSGMTVLRVGFRRGH
jgi:hypothetical protein